MHTKRELSLYGFVTFAILEARILDTVVATTVLAFGFVYIHPFVDGSERIDHYLFHLVLPQHGLNLPSVVFSISVAILERIDEYRCMLESYFLRLLPLIEWQPANRFNNKATNETRDFYHFFDAAPHTEFLEGCAQKTFDIGLPQETDFLRHHDQFRVVIENMFAMPERTVNLLFRFFQQNKGRLSARACGKEIAAPTDNEVERIETTICNFYPEASNVFIETQN